jgi:ketosteroid isomerase-like protein
MKYCATCNLEYPDASQFCKVCGKELGTVNVITGPVHCSSCGEPVQRDWHFCKQCGHASDEATVVREPATSHVQTQVSSFAPPAAVTAVVPSPQAATSALAVSAPREERCRTCGHRQNVGAQTCEACGAAVGSYARNLRVKKWLKVFAVVLGVCIFLTGLTAVGWYLLGVRVAIHTVPGDAKIVIDGEDVGRTNTYGSFTSGRLRAGDHSLAVFRDGYDTWDQDFSISFTDFSKGLNVMLNQTKYKLTVVTSPAGSEVLVDNKLVGKTSADDGTFETDRLLPGAHSVIVRSDGYRDWKQSVDLQKNTQLEVQLSAAPAVDQNASSVEDEVRGALAGWAQSVQNRDIDEHMRYYADTLDYYYSRTLIPSAKVREDRTKAFQKYTSLSLQLDNINVRPDSTGQRATVEFDKAFDFHNDTGAYFRGSVRVQLTLTKLGGAWLITGEKDLKVYDVKSSANP